MCFQRVRCCKTATFDNFCAISRATALEHHSANQFLKAATNLNFVQPKLFQASRQDDLRFSYCRVSVIQILDNADAAFRILCAYVDRSIRDHHVRRQAAPPQRTNQRAAILCFDDLASGTASRLGYPRSGLSRSDFVLWHFSDVTAGLRSVCCWRKSGSRDCVARLPNLTPERTSDYSALQSIYVNGLAI